MYLQFKFHNSVGFFRVEKILNTPSYGGEVKPSVPYRRFTACNRSLNVTLKSGIFFRQTRVPLAFYQIKTIGA
jgi:hypothetical protein